MVHHRAARRPAWIYLPRVGPAAQPDGRCRAADGDRDHPPYPHGHIHPLADAVPILIFDAATYANSSVGCTNVNAHDDAVAYIYADAHPNSNGHTDANPNSNGHTNINADPDFNFDANPNSDGHTNTNANADPDSDSNSNPDSNGHADANSNDDPNAHRDANDHANRDVIVVSHGPNADANAHRDANDHANRDVIIDSLGSNADANALYHGVSVARLAVRQWITCLPSSKG